MWEPQPLTTLWASTTCYRDNFTLPFINSISGCFPKRCFQPVQASIQPSLEWFSPKFPPSYLKLRRPLENENRNTCTRGANAYICIYLLSLRLQYFHHNIGGNKTKRLVFFFISFRVSLFLCFSFFFLSFNFVSAPSTLVCPPVSSHVVSEHEECFYSPHRHSSWFEIRIRYLVAVLE
jgi:hypothetical protein